MLEDDQLHEWYQDSRSSDGRERLVASDALRKAVASLPSAVEAWRSGTAAPPPLLVLLRALRNACAAGAPAAEQLLSVKAQDEFIALTVELANRCSLRTRAPAAAVSPPDSASSSMRAADAQLLLTAVQLLANFSVASGLAAVAIWEACWPSKWALLTSPALGVRVQAAACTALHAAVRPSPTRAREVCQRPHGRLVWLQLLQPLCADPPLPAHDGDPQQQSGAAEQAPQTAAAQGADGLGEWLGLLVKAVVLRHGLLLPLMHCLGGAANEGDIAADRNGAGGVAGAASGEAGSAVATDAGGGGRAGYRAWSAAQISILQFLAAEVSGSAGAASVGGAGCGASLRAAVAMLRDVAADVAAGGGLEAVHLLEALLLVLRTLTEREDGGCDLTGGEDAVLLLQDAGLVPLLVAMLLALGPPRNPRRPAPPLEQGAEEPAPLVAPLLPLCPREPPFVGYRSDVVATLANALFGRRCVQDELLTAGGVEALLSSCQLDEQSPVAQQWALWAVRNMCEGNARIQAHVAGIKLDSTVASPELQAMGLQLQLDRETGKMRLVDSHRAAGV